MHKSGEVRIGLVLYGGVSLAVYINGVAQEFFRAVRSDGIYRLLKALLGADIVVDVISGTSAGGLNGIYLAYALCQEPHPKNFLRFSELWRNHGDIDKLLRSPDDKSPQSLLDGEGYYQQKLEAAFTDLGAWQSSSEQPSELNELDLFITGTDFHGFVYTRFDGTGRPITVKDHRTLFQLKFRRGRYNDFAPSGAPDNVSAEELHGQLAKLARITSCFPVAFPPVRVAKEDRLISKWGQLSRKPLMPGETEQTPRYFLDGGVLDNKPFSSTTEAIFHRTATRPVTRKLFYVEPAPEFFDPDLVSTSPSVVQAGVGALTAIPGYESIAGDLEAIRERNTRIQQFRNLADSLVREPDASSGFQPTPVQTDLYRRSRLDLLLDRVLVGLLRQSGHEVLLGSEQQRLASRLFADFFRTFDAPAQDKVLHDFDVDLRMRRLFYVTYALDGVSSPGPDDVQAVDTCNRWIKCAEVIRFALESTVDQLPLRWYEESPQGPRLRAPADIWRETGLALGYVLAADAEVTKLLQQGPPDQAAVTRLRDTLLGRIRELTGQATAPVTSAPTLLQYLDQRFEQAGFLEGSAAARQAWEGFPWVDLHQYPLQAAAGLFELDFIDTVRISPKDAQLGFSRRPAGEKLSGDQLANFGGFFKRSWRSNDVLWGRLDGLARIFETLLSKDAVEAATSDPAGAAERLRAIVSMNLPPDLAAWLADLADPGRPGHQAALEALDPSRRGEEGGHLDQFVRYAQSDLVERGLQAVIEDNIQEQIEWNRCQTGDPGRTSFHIDGLRFTRPNSGFISLAAQQMALEALRTGQVPDVAAFFADRNKYSVGRETVADDVPKPVLVELATRTMLVMRNCLAPVGGAGSLWLRKSPLFKYGFDWPVRSAHGFAQLTRYAPTTARVATWVAAIYSVAALVVGLKWWQVFVWPPGQGLQVSALVTLIVVPVVLLGALPEILDWQYPRSKGIARSYGPWALLALVLGLAASGVVWLADVRAGLEQFLASKSGPISNALLAGCAVVAGALLVRAFRWALSLFRR